MALTLVVALLFATLSAAAPLAFAQSSPVATLTILDLPVEAGSPDQGLAFAADGQNIRVGDTIRTGATGAALVTYFDGSELLVGPDAEVRVDSPVGGSSGFAITQIAGTTAQRVVPKPGASYQTGGPSAVALVRGTTYVVTVARLAPTSAPPTASCTPGDPTCITSVILLPDPSGHVGRIEFQPTTTGLPTIDLTDSCAAAGAASVSVTSGPLAPDTCTRLIAATANLANAASAMELAQLAQSAAREQARSLGFGGGGGADSASSEPGSPTSSSDDGDLALRPLVTADQQEAELHRRVNVLRVRRGLPALRSNDTLNRVAREWSCRMAREGFFDHVSPSGDQPADRARAAGVSFSTLGENIAQSTNQPDPIAAAIEDWIDEGEGEGHFDNIYRDVFTESGVGICRQGSDFYATQLLRQP